MVRKQMEVNHFSLSYNQMGLIATVELAECDDNFVAWQRFLPNGVIALLPLSNNLSSIVWSTDVKHFKHLMQLNDTDFIDAVNNAFVRHFYTYGHFCFVLCVLLCFFHFLIGFSILNKLT